MSEPRENASEVVGSASEEAKRTSESRENASEVVGSASEEANELGTNGTDAKKRVGLNAREKLIVAFLIEHETATTRELARALNLSEQRTRVVVREMVARGILIAEGQTSARMYRL